MTIHLSIILFVPVACGLVGAFLAAHPKLSRREREARQLRPAQQTQRPKPKRRH